MPIRLIFLLFVLLFAGCASLPSDVQRTTTTALAKEATESTHIGHEVTALVNKHAGRSGFYVLNDGIDAFAARLTMVEKAEKSVDVQYYIWHDDMTGRVLHNRLLAAADRGVRVRLLLDDLDTAGKDEMLHIIDAHPNIEIRLFNPFANRTKRVGDFLGDTSRINRRMHNKTITADNQVSIFGGRNIGDEYFDATEDVGFRDMDALAIGPVVQEISQGFDLYWNSEWVYPLSAFESERPITEVMIKEFRLQSDAYLQEAISSEYAIVARAHREAGSKNVHKVGFVWSPWVLVYDQPSKVVAEEVKVETHLGPKLKKAMDKTEKELLIVSPYFVPGSKFTDYLVGLESRGVEVHILTNSLASNDVSLVHAGYMRYRERLVSGGVDLYEFKPVDKEGSDKKEKKGSWVGASRSSLHGKFFGFDQEHLFIGSFNLDGRSVALNTELGVYFKSEKHAKMMSEAFKDKVIHKAYKVTLDEDGDMVWVTQEDGKEVRFDQEPETGVWKRFSTDFLSIIVPENQL
jgi:putative cardiolipin synthase